MDKNKDKKYIERFWKSMFSVNKSLFANEYVKSQTELLWSTQNRSVTFSHVLTKYVFVIILPSLQGTR